MNRDELEALVRIHQAELYRYLRYLGASDRARAEDLVQETFLAAFRSPGPRDADERVQAAWLRGIARNLFFAHCRRSRREHSLDQAALDQAEAVWANEFLSAGNGFDYLEALRKCLTRLNARQRRFLDLRYAESKSRAEMAAALDMSEDGIKTGLQRIRALLSDCIQQRLRTEQA